MTANNLIFQQLAVIDRFSTNAWFISQKRISNSIRLRFRAGRFSNAAKQGIAEAKALAVGMAEKAKEFVATGSEIYHGNLPIGENI